MSKTQFEEIHSTEMQDIIGKIPGLITQWGTTILFGLLILLIVISQHLYIPVTVKAEATLYAGQQPMRIAWMKTDEYTDIDIVLRTPKTVKKGDTLLKEVNKLTHSAVYHTATVSGKVSFFRGTKNQPRATVLLVTPLYANYDIELIVPITGAGQVQAGQKVLLHLDEFPESKYGFLIGKVTSISSVALDGGYRAKVALSNGLRTNINYKVPLQASLHGEAEIITENISIFDKLFNSLI